MIPMRARSAGPPAAFVAIAVTGFTGLGRRLGARVLHKDPRPPLDRFGFHARDPASRKRIGAIIEAFFTGYNAALEEDDAAGVRRRCSALPEVLHPFAFEGTGMGYGARGLVDWSSRPSRFESHIASVEPGWEFMYYVGLGIWTAFIGAWSTRRAAAAVGNRHLAGLLFDGLGFQRGFFHRVRNSEAHQPLVTLEPDDRAQAFRGFGRSLWFVYRDDPQGLVDAVRALPEAQRADTITGVGLAIVFTAADELGAACRQLESLPSEWQRELQRGLRLALAVRHHGQPEALEGWIAAAASDAPRLRSDLMHAIRAHDTTRGRDRFLVDFTAAC